MIKRSIPWTRQPQYPAGINRASPFYRGLTNLIAVINGRPIQIVGTGMTLNGTLTSKVGSNGVSITNNGEKVSSGAVSNYISLPVLTSECSVLVYGSRYTTPPASNVATLSCTRSSTEAAGLEIAYGNAFGDANALYLSTFGSASGMDCYADGALLTGNNPTNKVVITGVPICFVGAITSHTVGSGHTVLAKAAGTGDFAYDVGLVLYGTWNRKLSAVESIKLTANPWQIFAPQERNIYISVAGGGLNVTGLFGTADATGLTANVDKQLAITATLATATAAGLTAQVDTQVAITATLATATADGLTANVDKQRAISGTLATATASGITAGVDTQLAIAGSLATATAGGIAATIDQQLAIAATLATATADGTTATIDRQLTIAGALATATAGGIQATISNGLTINATLATATAAGFNANIDNQIAISGSLATAIADGISASISFGNDLNISASLGTATASGLTAGVDSQAAVTATLGQATADGFSASVTLASSWTGEPFNFASPITRNFDFSSSITNALSFDSPI